MKYYRQLEANDVFRDGDGYFSGNEFITVRLTPGCRIEVGNLHIIYFRPVTITEAPPAPPEPPAHRVEEETWIYRDGWIRPIPEKRSGVLNSALVCQMPTSDKDFQAAKIIQERAKRICAGQEALKYLERIQRNNFWIGEPKSRLAQILAPLKD